MYHATASSYRLKICSNTIEPGKIYLEKDREDHEKFKFETLGERKIIKIISSCEIHPNFKKIYYYSKTKNKKIITSNLGAEYEGKLLLETFGSYLLKHIEMINVGCNHKEKYPLKERERKTLDKHLERIKDKNLKGISIGDAVKSFEYIIENVKSSY